MVLLSEKQIMTMKNKLLTLFSLVLLIGFSACTKTEYYPEKNPNRTVHEVINANDWIPNADKTKWSVELNVPEIDGPIMDHGSVFVDIAFGKDNRGEYIYEPMTTVFDGMVYRYDYTLGSLLVDVSMSGEFAVPVTRPPGANLKILLVDSESLN